MTEIVIDPKNSHVVVVTPGPSIGGVARAVAECSRCGVLVGGVASLVIQIAEEHDRDHN